MRKTDWTPEQDATLREYANKESADKIGERVGMTAQQVYRRAQRLKIALYAKRRGYSRKKYAPEEKQRVADLKAGGMQAAEIAKTTGIPLGTVQVWLYSKAAKNAQPAPDSPA